jgi:hypothetical protein
MVDVGEHHMFPFIYNVFIPAIHRCTLSASIIIYSIRSAFDSINDFDALIYFII